MMENNKKNILYGLFGLASMLGAALGYVYGHKPFTPENLLGVLRAVWQLAAACCVVALAAGLGERILRGRQINGAERLAVAFGIGMGSLSLILLALGLTVGYPIWLIAPLFLAALMFLRSDIARWLLTWSKIKATDVFEKTIALCVGVLIFCALLTALAPPLEFDALVYHLTLPRMYLDAGRIFYIPEIVYWGMPQLAELQYLLAMQFGGVESATALGVLIGGVALGGIFGVAKKYFGTKAAWMTIAALLAGESLSASLSWGYVEWTSILFGVATLVALIRWLKRNEPMDLLLTGALAGFALSVKYTNGVLLLTVLLAVALVNRRTLKQRFADATTLGALAALVSLPWWIKNMVATGNPFYPLLFKSGEIDATRLMFFRSSIPWDNWQTWLSALFLPIQATVYGIEGAEGFSASIGPLLLAFSLVAWMDWKERTPEQRNALYASAVVTLGGMLVWAMGSRFSSLLIQSRLYYVIFPAWAFLAGAGFDSIWRRSAGSVRLGRMAGTLAIFMLGLNVFQTLVAFTAQNPTAVIFNLVAPETYIAHNMGAYASAMKTINALPKNSRVLMLWETRGYYCLPLCDPDEVIDRWVSDLRREGAPQAVLQNWKAQGYTHVLVYELGAQFVKKHDQRIHLEEWRALDVLFASLHAPEHIGGAYTLWKLDK